MEEEKHEKTTIVLTVVLLISCYVNTIGVYAFGESKFNEPEEILSQLVKYENSHNWSEFAKLCTKEYGSQILDVEDGVGIKGTESAELKFLDEIDKSMVPEYAISKTDKECIYFVMGIDYVVGNATKFFYNGINYRLASLTKEDGEWKLFSRTDIPKEILAQYCENTYSTYGINEKIDFNTAMSIMSARNSGYILDSDLSVKDIIADMDDTLINVTDIFQLERDFRPGISPYTICMDARPSTVRVEGYGAVGIYPYVQVVLPCEWTISISPNAALAAAVVMIEQYATWNVLYFQKYPDLGYDVKAGDSDQVYNPSKYNGMQQIYKDMVNAAWATSSHMHMETQDNYFFESQYFDTTANRTVELAENGYSYQEILHDIYDGKNATYGGISIGTIRIREYKYFYSNPN